mgnify:CR=1 FL=1
MLFIDQRNKQGLNKMTSFEVTVYDELNGGTDTLTIQAKTIDQGIDVVESNPNHEYEIIEIERINPWNA